MSKQVIICVLIISALSSAVVHSKKSVSSYDKNEEIVARIVNGTDASQGQSPWSMGIYWVSRKVIGMAALITPQTALTAAHIFFDPEIDRHERAKIPLHEIEGRIGDIRFSHAKILHFLDDVIHENYDHVHELNDIALLILQESLELSQRIKTISLPKTPKTYSGEGTVAGWGRTSKDSNDSPEILQVVELKISDPSRCRDSLHDARQKEMYICTSGDGKGPYEGDSGAPLIHSKLLKKLSIGVLHGERHGCKIGECPLFTGTGRYANWIEFHAEGKVTFIS